MIPSSSCPPRQPEQAGQTRRRAQTHCRSYTTPWGTILADRTEGVSAFVLGKDETGECTAKQAALTPSPDFTATQAGPRMVQIRGTKVLPRTMVSGLFVM